MTWTCTILFSTYRTTFVLQLLSKNEQGVFNCRMKLQMLSSKISKKIIPNNLIEHFTHFSFCLVDVVFSLSLAYIVVSFLDSFSFSLSANVQFMINQAPLVSRIREISHQGRAKKCKHRLEEKNFQVFNKNSITTKIF